MNDDALTFAKKYLEDLLTFFGLNTEVDGRVNEDEIIELAIPSTHLNGFLIGQHGDVLRATQFLVSSALLSQGFSLRRVNVDVADYKKQRAERLASQVEGWISEVKDGGTSKALQAMNAADRRLVHKMADEAGLVTESVGEGRERHVILKPLDK